MGLALQLPPLFLSSSDGFVPRSMFRHKDERASAVWIPATQNGLLKETRATDAVLVLKSHILKYPAL